MTRSVSVLARFKDNPGYYRQIVECRDSDSGGMFCGRDCDGGGFGATPKDDGLLLNFGPGNGGGLSLESACDPDEEGRDRWLDPKDDQEFVSLRQWPIAECMAPDRDAHPAYAEDPMPLRERVRIGGWRCLKRVYDAAHLKKHPQQNVAAIAVAIPGLARTTTDADGYTLTELDVTLSLKLRKGERASKALTCQADEFQFRCGEDFRLRRRDGYSTLLLAGAYGLGGDPPNPSPQLAGLSLGSDDERFRLDASVEANCSLD